MSAPAVRVPRGRAVEWPTVLLLAACYTVWALGTTWAVLVWLPLGIFVTALALTLHSSLQHEALHGHPFRSATLNEALVFPALGLFIPYRRFRDTHLAHHLDSNLTDPYDDPESNYLDRAVWASLPGWQKRILLANNTLLGRMLLGPVISQVAFLRQDWAAIRRGDGSVQRAWLLHGVALVPVALWLGLVAAMPAWAYVLAAYMALGILKIRTYLEHRAHVSTAARTVIVEDRGPLALLFLNNNLHVVHHLHPRVPWYRLPALYAANPDRYLKRNDDYRYRSYGEVLWRYLLHRKDPVPHPFLPAGD